MLKKILSLTLLLTMLITTGCLNAIVSQRRDSDPIWTTSSNIQEGEDVLGTIHVEAYGFRLLFWCLGPNTHDLNMELARKAKSINASKVVGVQYSPHDNFFCTASASGTAIK